MKKQLLTLFDFVGWFFKMPSLDSYTIEQRPQRNTAPMARTRTTEHKVFGGKIHRDTVADDGTIETKIGHDRPNSASDVTIDAFDVAALDALIGTKWAKSRDRAVVMKWHWLNAHSARQIEKEHTDKKTREIERGFSERTAAEYVAAFYEADNNREKAGRPRMRDAAKSPENPAAQNDTTAKIFEW